MGDTRGPLSEYLARFGVGRWLERLFHNKNINSIKQNLIPLILNSIRAKFSEASQNVS
jgi:hypothetical protein